MLRRFFARLLLLATVAILAGCALPPLMPLAESDPKADTDPPLYLMSVVVKNTFKERWQPRILNVVLTKKTAAGTTENRVYRMDDKGTIATKIEGGSTTYLVRLRAGDSFTSLTGMNAIASAFPVNGFYFVPLHASLENDGPGIYYLGSVQAAIRERKENEFRAGPVLPLIDQAVAGASTGTFDITILDQYDKDLELFRSAFPALTGASVVKKLLSPWDRTKAQLEWEKN